MYSSTAHTHINVWSHNPDLFNFPHLKLHEEKLGFGAVRLPNSTVFLLPSRRLTYRRLLAAQFGGVVDIFIAFAGPPWALIVIGILGLAFEIPLGTVADDNFAYLISVGPGLIYPVTSGTCTNGMLSSDQVAFYTNYTSVTATDLLSVCEDFAQEGTILQIVL